MKKENEYYWWREKQPRRLSLEDALCLILGVAAIILGAVGFLDFVDHLPVSPAELSGKVERGPSK